MRNRSEKLHFFFLFTFQILQNLGKVDRTADEIFDEHLTNFSRQQLNATKLQKEFNNYIRCIRGTKNIVSHSIISTTFIHSPSNWQHAKQHRKRWWMPFAMSTKRHGLAPKRCTLKFRPSKDCGKSFPINLAIKCWYHWMDTLLNFRKWRWMMLTITGIRF